MGRERESLDELEKRIDELTRRYYRVLESICRTMIELEHRELMLALNYINVLLARARRDSNLLVKKGEILLSLGRYEEALSCFERALSIAETDDALRGLAIALCQLGKFREAVRRAKKLLFKDPSFASVLVSTAVNATGSLDSVSEVLEELERLATESEALREWLDGLKMTAQDGSSVIEMLRQALEEDPNAAEVWVYLGVIYSEIGNTNVALSCIENAIDINAMYAEAWWWRGAIFLERKMFEDALESFDMALKLNPDNVDAWIGKGQVFLAMQAYEDALACFDRALQIDPTSSHIWKWKARVLELLGREKEAERCKRIAQTLDSQ